MKISILGAGSMGSGIAQVASQSGHKVVLCDMSQEQLDKAKAKLAKIINGILFQRIWILPWHIQEIIHIKTILLITF